MSVDMTGGSKRAVGNVFDQHVAILQHPDLQEHAARTTPYEAAELEEGEQQREDRDEDQAGGVKRNQKNAKVVHNRSRWRGAPILLRVNMETNSFDAIVVGTGMSGGWAAKELTEKGLKTLVLDRGRMVRHGEYPTATKDPWDLPYGNRITQETRRRKPVLVTHRLSHAGERALVRRRRRAIPMSRNSPSTGCAPSTSAAVRCIGRGRAIA